MNNKLPNSKDVVGYLISSFDLKNVNWGFQMRLANSLLKRYNFNEIKYAIDYYKNLGITITSLGFLTYKSNRKDPVSMYHAESNIQGGEESGDRNRKRIAINNQTYNRTQYPSNLFEESDEID